MHTISRLLSLWLRRIKRPLLIKKELKAFHVLKAEVSKLPATQIQPNTLLLIRLDDIGDYVLWRNSFHFYKQCERWKNHTITLLGNIAWKTLFDKLDKDAADATIWINKKSYYNNNEYRKKLWLQLRESGFETVICPSNTRPLLLDDMCMLAAGSATNIASENTFGNEIINKVSDALYSAVYQSKKSYHEFLFNQHFANWCCQTNYFLQRPFIHEENLHKKESNYILCYVGASKRSRRWPAKNWVQLIKKLNKIYSKKVLVSCGPAEDEMAKQIAKATGAVYVPGATSLPEMLDYAAFADVVITNNTMMAHIAPACNKPTIIIDNGDNFSRMTAYKEAGIGNVETVYAKPFLKEWKKKNYELFSHYVAVSSDIKTITAAKVVQALQQLDIK